MNWNSMSHYEVLQVAPTAPLSVIKASYKTLIQQYHPDPDSRAAHDVFLAQRSARSDIPPESPAPPSSPSSQLPEVDPEKTTWWGRIAMLFMLLCSGYIGSGLLGGGAIPYLIGAGAGGVLFAFGRRWWASWNAGGKALLFIGWVAICLSGMVFKQMRINELSPVAPDTAKSADGAPVNEGPTQQSGPPSGFVLDSSGPAPDPRDTYLQMHFEQLNERQYSEAVDRWLEAHPEASSVESRRAMSQLLQEVYTQNPRSALGPALDMALQRGQRNTSSNAAQNIPANCVEYTSREIPSKYNGARISFNLEGIALQTFLNLIQQESNKKIIPVDDVSAGITTCLINIPWDYALDKVLTERGYGQTEYNGTIRVFKR